MNKKIGLGILIVLILSGAFYFYINSSRTEAPDPLPSAVNESSDLNVELLLKTAMMASDSAVINVSLPAGSDHCEVLKKALDEGKLKDLDMRYQEKYQTNGVYVINGLGKTDSPWWVYKINGSDAPAGCSQVKVNQGDKILWEYIGE